MIAIFKGFKKCGSTKNPKFILLNYESVDLLFFRNMEMLTDFLIDNYLDQIEDLTNNISQEQVKEWDDNCEFYELVSDESFESIKSFMRAAML